MERTADDELGPSRAARLWTSSLLRTVQTASMIPHPVIKGSDGSLWESMSPRIYRNIDEIFAGDCEGLTPEEVKLNHPQASHLRKMDKIGKGRGRARACISSHTAPRFIFSSYESRLEPLNASVCLFFCLFPRRHLSSPVQQPGFFFVFVLNSSRSY